MTQIVYVSDGTKQSIDFINDLISDLRKLNIKDIEHDKENNLIIVGNIEVRGISVFESCLCLKVNHSEYFIDSIDMRKYKDTSSKRLDYLIYSIKEVMSHFGINAKQISGKEELIKILTENFKSMEKARKARRNEMISALYMTKSEEKSEKFLKDLKEDLEDLGIEDIDIGGFGCKIKTKDFFVESRVIFGGGCIATNLEGYDCILADEDLKDYGEELKDVWDRLDRCYKSGIINMSNREQIIKFLTIGLKNV